MRAAMRLKVQLLVGAVVASTAIAVPTAGSAVTPVVIHSLQAVPSSVPYTGGNVKLTGVVSGASRCTFSSSPHLVGLPVTVSCKGGRAVRSVHLPANPTQLAHSYAVTLVASGAQRRARTVHVVVRGAPVPALGKVRQIAPDLLGYCALFTSGRVECWGYGLSGELGNGLYTGGGVGVAVKGVGGSGLLSGVSKLYSDGQGMCAVLTSHTVDCWGYGGEGELGDGKTAESNVPVGVKSVGGTGLLTGVASLAAYAGTNGRGGYCALLLSGGVDCWGFGPNGQLGNGVFYTTGIEGSDVPVAVKAVGGVGTLAGVAHLAGLGSNGLAAYCALLISGGVDCWGYGQQGELGDGSLYITGNYGASVPVAVKAVGGTGTLTGVASVVDGTRAFCAVLLAGGVVCWGDNVSSQLGNGSPGGTFAIPESVVGVGGTGTLTSVSAVATEGAEGYCALLVGGGVDCWGNGGLGDGVGDQSDVPKIVLGVGGTGTLSGVSSLAATSYINNNTYCALRTTTGVDCWGDGSWGALGDGVLSGDALSPGVVVGVGGTSTLAGITSVTGSSGDDGFCAITAAGGAVCWGYGLNGELGNGQGSNSGWPVAVVFHT